MEKIKFTDNWSCKKEGETAFAPVILPHDAMIHEKRDPKSPGGSAHGFFNGGKYVYEKHFEAPAEWREKHVLLEFEGVYRNSVVFVNGKEAGSHRYGYTPFTVELDQHLQYGKSNVITVEADNSRLPNSRWYSGSGIYRPVSLYIGNKTYIAHQGVKIRTESVSPAIVRVETGVNGGEVSVEILDAAGKKAASGKGTDCRLEIPDAKLWDAEHPYLYQCRVTLSENGSIVETVTEAFGIRKLSWSAKGLFINGKKILLRGGCVHHDNGILGAAAWDKSEERRVRIMKENGFNAIRASHNPASAAMLRACDKYGMYLIDETFDMWYVRKSRYDYGLDFKDCWREDTRAMVERDFNHPSVIMYSIGNEVSEPGKPEGVKQGKEIISFIKSLDESRVVTGGMNLMIMGNYAKGKGQYDNVDQEDEDREKKKKAGGDRKGGEPKNASLAFNIMASMVGSGMNKAGNSAKVDAVTAPILDALDIAGYNYASGRYPLEGKAHPDRVIFGSETFPQDIYKNWEMVKKYPYLVGDFMWTAWDYLGEAGIGAWSYTGGMPFSRPYPWILGGAGVIDILGNPDVSCRNAQIVWDQKSEPVIGVRPVNHPGVRVSKSVWRGTNAVESWSWKGCDGNKALVEVHSKAPVVELFLNGRSLGKKKTKEAQAVFQTKYQSGAISVTAYDVSGRVMGKNELKSSVGNLHIAVEPEEREIRKGDIVYIPVSIKGENGVVECNADRRLDISVENGTLLAFGGANPCTEESYDAGSFTSYLGRALAVVYANAPGRIRVRVQGAEISSGGAEISVTE